MQDSLISHLLLLEIVAVSDFAQSYAFLSRDIDMSLLYLLTPAVVTNWVTTGKKNPQRSLVQIYILKSIRRMCETLTET